MNKKNAYLHVAIVESLRNQQPYVCRHMGTTIRLVSIE